MRVGSACRKELVALFAGRFQPAGFKTLSCDSKKGCNQFIRTRDTAGCAVFSCVKSARDDGLQGRTEIGGTLEKRARGRACARPSRGPGCVE